jgi:hypothetical protein
MMSPAKLVSELLVILDQKMLPTNSKTLGLHRVAFTCTGL